MSIRKLKACLMAAFFIGLMQSTVISAPIASLTANTSTPVEGDTFEVTLNIAGAAPFVTWGEILRFDTAMVALISQAMGSFTNFISDSRILADINTSGEIRSGGFYTSPTGGFVNNAGGDGTLGIFRFKARVPGEAVFITESKSVSTPFGNILKALDGTSELPDIAGPLTITIKAQEKPKAPVFLTLADSMLKTASLDSLYLDTVLAIDSNTNDSVKYSLIDTIPNGMTIDSLTGVLSWQPVRADTGAHLVSIIAKDLGGLSDTLQFELLVQYLGVDVEKVEKIWITLLEGISPNPFNPSMNIAYQVSSTDSKLPVSLKVYNSRGRLVKILADGVQHSGRHLVFWNAVGVPSGVYMIKYECGRYSAMRKAMLVK